MSPSLDIDPEFQRRQWRLEKAGWLILWLLALAALAGASGSGWLSWHTVSSDDSALAVDYERIAHRQADAFVTVELRAAGDAEVVVEIFGDWLEAADLRGISPEPVEQVALPGGLRLTVAVSGSGTCQLHLSFRAERPGLLTGEITARGQSVTFRQLVLP